MPLFFDQLNVVNYLIAYMLLNYFSSRAHPCHAVILSGGDTRDKQSCGSAAGRSGRSAAVVKRPPCCLRAVNYSALFFSCPRRMRLRRAAQPRRLTINKERGGLKKKQTNKNCGGSGNNNNNQRAIVRRRSGGDETPPHVRTTQQQKEPRLRHRRLPEMNDSGGV